MGIFFILIALLLFGFYHYSKNQISPKVKGIIGEQKAALLLRHLNKEEYVVLNDILLQNKNLTSQIDHIVISKSGIFVIETKNYKGWIHGHQNSEFWTQTIYKHKRKLRNPIKQNWSHIYAIKNILSDFNYIKYYPIVVFTGSGKIKNVTSDYPVIYLNNLIRTIRSIDKEENLSHDQIKIISERIKERNIVDREVSKQHNKQVKAQTHERRELIRQKICPRCNNSLVLRHGKYGRFYGCENFPECRFTIKKIY